VAPRSGFALQYQKVRSAKREPAMAIGLVVGRGEFNPLPTPLRAGPTTATALIEPFVDFPALLLMSDSQNA